MAASKILERQIDVPVNFLDEYKPELIDHHMTKFYSKSEKVLNFASKIAVKAVKLIHQSKDYEHA